MDSNQNIQNDQLKNFSDKKKQNPFSVPGSYFDKLSEKIAEKISDTEELKQLSPTPSEIKKENHFSVPENYFENLPEKIAEKIEVYNLSFEKSNPFKLPENYFENLTDEIESKVTAQNFDVKKSGAFNVPENYFENLSEIIQSKVSQKQRAKIISLNEYFGKYKYSAMAVAASLAVLISLYFYFSPSDSVSKKQLYVSAEDISNSFYFEEIDETVLIEELNENSLPNPNSDIENYLIENDVGENTIISEL